MKKSILKKVFTVIVTMAMFTMFSQPMVEAATTKFISEVVLAYGDDDNEAKQKLKDAGYAVLPKNLNVEASKFGFDGPCVYMGYKTSTNVEDAITDFAVMDMFGGYNVGNYQIQVEQSMSEYRALLEDYLVVSEEFKKNYEAGNVMAQAAYRQLNYYIDDDTQMQLGDFMMNIPSDDALATVLMQGNVNVINNLSILLAMGVAGTDEKSFQSRYQENAKTPEKFKDLAYYDDAKAVSDSVEKLVSQLMMYKEELENPTVIKSEDGEEPENSEATESENEEEMFEALQYYAIAPMYDCLKSVEYEGTTMLDLILSRSYSVEDFYPMVAAMTDGQRAMTRLGFLQFVLSYNTTDKTAEGYDEMLDKAEAQLTEKISVYYGVDRSIFTENYAFTSDALRHEADTGDSFFNGISSTTHISSAIAMASGVILLTVSFVKFMRSNFLYKSYMKSYDPIFEKLFAYSSSVRDAKIWKNAKIGWGIGMGVAALIISISVGLEIWNHYHPDYKVIPDVLIDISETTSGDHYIRYDAVMNVEPDEDGKIVPGDLNGLFARQWNALYVTKDFSAGKPLTATSIKYSNDSSKLAKGYAPVHYFGEEVLFNLNEHQFSSAKPVYLSFKQSNAKKAAEKVPDVIATNISYGIAALTGGVGIVAGMGIMGLISRKKRKETDVKGED